MVHPHQRRPPRRRVISTLEETPMPTKKKSAKKTAPKSPVKSGFVYSKPFQTGKDDTKYRLVAGAKGFVKKAKFAGKPVLVVDPKALTVLAHEAMRDVSFLLRPKHQQQVASILKDPEKISKGIWQTYTGENLRYSQTAALTMYDEVNTGNNLPAQIDIYAAKGAEYKFLFVAKGGGSANKTILFQETKALLNPASLEAFLVEKMKSLGTAACPPCRDSSSSRRG